VGAINVVLINSVGELRLDEWHCDLIRCPSQCYYWTKDASGVDCVLYMRWRWDDPWSGYVIRNANSVESLHRPDAVWSADLLGEFDFAHDEYEAAQRKMIDLFATNSKTFNQS